MRKILIISTILILPLNFLFGQDQNTEDFNLKEMVDNLGDYNLTEFQEVLKSEDAKGDGTDENPGFVNEIKQKLKDEGVDQSVIDVVDTTVQEIQTAEEGTEVTFNKVLEKNPDKKAAVEDALAEMIAETAVNNVFGSPQQEEDIRNGLRTMNRAVSILNGFGRANAQSSVASSLFAHQGYKLFAVSLGVTGALAAPLSEVNTVMDIYEAYGEEEDKLLAELDDAGIKTGISFQAFVLNFGINVGFLLDGLYLGGVVGGTSLDVNNEEAAVSVLGANVYKGEGIDTETKMDLSFSSGTYGIRANYQLIKPFSIPILLRWNGINVGTGFIFNTFNIGGEADISETMTLDPNTLIANIDIRSNTYTIPLDISTGIRLLSVINIGVGAGVDVAFGNSEFEIGLKNNIQDNIARKVLDKTFDKIFAKENLTFPLVNEGDVEFFNPRIQAAVGVGLGPVSVDFNLTAYPLAGITFGVNAILRL